VNSEQWSAVSGQLPINPLMPKPAQQSTFDAALVSQLACPACLGDLRLVEDRLVCAGCGRGYPVVDGIPVLIAERADAVEARGDRQE
jgi:uncharacterized protein YbaR (Trm112 family)